MTTETTLLTSQYHRRLIEAGVTAQGNDAPTIAAAIARREAEGIPLNLLQRQAISRWEAIIRRADLWRDNLLSTDA